MIVLHRLIIALILYVFCILLIFATRPSLMFKADGSPKEFGVGLIDGKSIFALSFVLPVLAFICYFVSCIVQIAVT